MSVVPSEQFEVGIYRAIFLPANYGKRSSCRILPLVLPRFRDGPSRFHAHQLIKLLLLESPAVASRFLTLSLWDAFSRWADLVPSVASAKTALAALQWTAAIYRSLTAASPEETAALLVRLQAVLASVVFGCQSSRLASVAKHLLKAMWKENEAVREVHVGLFVDKIEYTHQVV